METLKTTLPAVLCAMALGLVSHALIGYAPFPTGDDFAYAPLADYKADPSLFPKDMQLRLFANHARVYDWVYGLGQSGPGVEPVFRVAIWLQAMAASLALWAILAALGAPLAALPAVLGVGVVVSLDGLGRGDYGGLIAPFFHHHNVALVLVLGAMAAVLRRRFVLAGLCLGAAAYGQPMTALHGALVVGLGVLAVRPRAWLSLSLVAVVVAAPAALEILGQMPEASGPPDGLDLIRDAYRFRAPLHYDPAWPAVGLTTLYLLIGWLGVVVLDRVDRPRARMTAGMMTGFTLLHLVTLTVYKLGFGEWTPFFILDANRSTPLLFAFGPALLLVGLWRGADRTVALAGSLLLVALALFNLHLGSLLLLAGAAVLLVLGRLSWGAAGSALVSLAAASFLFPPSARPPAIPEPTREALLQIRSETPHDALFVIPVGLFAFRHYARRSAYVDFKLFSVAQPEQAALTRRRIMEVAAPADALRSATGWEATRLWDEAQRRQATCEVMQTRIAMAQADYYLRALGPGEAPPDCAALTRSITTETLALYAPRR